MAHDEHNISAMGDKVRLAETRPLSRRKRWRISEIVEKSKARTKGDGRDSAAEQTESSR